MKFKDKNWFERFKEKFKEFKEGGFGGPSSDLFPSILPGLVAPTVRFLVCLPLVLKGGKEMAISVFFVVSVLVFWGMLMLRRFYED